MRHGPWGDAATHAPGPSLRLRSGFVETVLSLDAEFCAKDLNPSDQNEICTPAMKVRAAPGTTMF